MRAGRDRTVRRPAGAGGAAGAPHHGAVGRDLPGELRATGRPGAHGGQPGRLRRGARALRHAPAPRAPLGPLDRPALAARRPGAPGGRGADPADDRARRTPSTAAPSLRLDRLAGAAVEPDASDIDVLALHQGYVRGLGEAGGTVVRSARVTALDGGDDGWQVRWAGDELTATTVVLAAGAWGDELARAAGAAPIGLRPLRRTIAVCRVPSEAALDPARTARLRRRPHVVLQAGGPERPGLAGRRDAEPAVRRPRRRGGRGPRHRAGQRGDDPRAPVGRQQLGRPADVRARPGARRRRGPAAGPACSGWSGRGATASRPRRPWPAASPASSRGPACRRTSPRSACPRRSSPRPASPPDASQTCRPATGGGRWRAAAAWAVGRVAAHSPPTFMSALATVECTICGR